MMLRKRLELDASSALLVSVTESRRKRVKWLNGDSCVILQKMSMAAETYRAWFDEKGIHQQLVALPLLLPLALAMFTHPLILDRFHTPSLYPPPPPASSLACSRCGVAIATEICGNTSVLQSAGTGGGAEGETERKGDRQSQGVDSRREEVRKWGKDCLKKESKWLWLTAWMDTMPVT